MLFVVLINVQVSVSTSSRIRLEQSTDRQEIIMDKSNDMTATVTFNLAAQAANENHGEGYGEMAASASGRVVANGHSLSDWLGLK
jgi:hypothetical protein